MMRVSAGVILLAVVVATSAAPAKEDSSGAGIESSEGRAGQPLPGETCSGNDGNNCTSLIPDGPGGVLVSSFEFPFDACRGLIRDVNIGVAIDHSNIGDLSLSISGPNLIPLGEGGGPEVSLFNRDCGGSFSMGAIWDDEGTPHPCPPIGFGRWLPEENLEAFDGFLPDATWELQVEDHAAGDVGFLLDWSVEVTCSAPGACCLPGGSCIVIDDFSCIVELGGTYLGDGTTCDEVVCEVPAMPFLGLVALGLLLIVVGWWCILPFTGIHSRILCLP